MPQRRTYFTPTRAMLRRASLWFPFLCLSAVAPLAATERYTPNHPVVREMIRKGLSSLETEEHYQLGGNCLISLPFLNEGVPKNHPKLIATMKGFQREETAPDADSASRTSLTQLTDNYNAALAAIFLSNYDARGEHDQIRQILRGQLSWQRQHGGWGYMNGATTSGDTSQTQYAVLAIWYGQFYGAIELPVDQVANVLNWLLATQDPDGNWGYQGNVANGNERIAQTDKTHSLCAAALSSVYACANMLRLIEPRAREVRGVGPLRPVEREEPAGSAYGRKGPLTTKVSISRLKQAIQDGNAWYDKNLTFDVAEWTYFHFYAHERYRSFREMAEGVFEESPAWYNLGVEALRKSQAKDGSWMAKHSGDKLVDTAVATLFLQRSTQKMLEPLRDGRLGGGKGLPQDLQDARVIGGKVQGRQLEGTMNDLLAALDDPRFDAADRMQSAQTLPAWSDQPAERQRQIERLRRFVTHDSHGPRLAAVRLLAKTKGLDEVPYLIYALTDPDPAVMFAAQEGLQTLSRKVRDFELSEEPTRAEVLEAAAAWKAWYRSLRPNATFLD